MSSTLTAEPRAIGPTPEELKLGPPAQSKSRNLRAGTAQAGLPAVAHHAPPRHPVEEPGDVHGRGGHGADHHLHGRQTLRVPSAAPLGYLLALDFWLVATLLFANFASAIAEARGKAQADALRKTRRATPARRFRADGTTEQVASTDLRAGDTVEVVAGEVVPGDGEIIEGVASIDESAITGESAPVIREAGGDRSGVTGGTRVLSDRIVVEITASPGGSFLDRMIALVEGAIRQRTPNEIALSLVLAAFTLIFLIVTATLWPIAYNVELYMKDFTGAATAS